MTPIGWLIIAMVVLPLSYLAWGLLTADRRGLLAVQANLGQGLTRNGGGIVRRPPALLDLSKRLAIPSGPPSIRSTRKIDCG
jgi:tight adherence protein C